MMSQKIGFDSENEDHVMLSNVINMSFMTSVFEIIQSLGEMFYLMMEFNGLKVEELRIRWQELFSTSLTYDKEKPWNMTIVSITIFLLFNIVILLAFYMLDVYLVKYIDWPDHLKF